MALTLNSDRSMRSYSQIVALVEAVTGAAADDESHAVEWKSVLDLSSRAGQFAVARTILGMANRPVRLASASFEGVGYVVVGASVGGVVDIPAVDSAVLHQGIVRYVGADGPVWSQMSVDVDGKNVVVFIVEPPRAGDRLHTLAKEFTPEGKSAVLAGTVFVRKNGLTRPAEPADVRELEKRMLAGGLAASPEGVVSWAGDARNVLLVNDSAARVAQWIAAERTALMAGTNSVVKWVLAIADRRTTTEFGAEVEEYLAQCERLLPDVCRDGVMEELGTDPWVLRFENTGEDVMTGVRVQILLPDGLEAYQGPSHALWPNRPIAFGDYTAALVATVAAEPSAPLIPGVNLRPGVSVQRDDSGWSVRYQLGDVHPHEVVNADSILFVGVLGVVASHAIDLKAVITAGNRRSTRTVSLALDNLATQVWGPRLS